MIAQVLLGAAFGAGVANAVVTAAGTMGVTNPTAAVLGTPVNQSSDSRLISLNAIDDFCIFSPPKTGSTIGDTEGEQVAWCVQPRNNARVIPDGTFSAVHFVKTPLYWQIQGWGDLTKLNIAPGDMGGELDPHGATGLGNPVGGNVTTNATGSDVSYEEWMNYISYQQFCLRICISENSTYPAEVECQHTLDEMGCSWVMPGDYTNGTFTECDGDSAYPPGVYPVAGGGLSTFAQRYTGTYNVSGSHALFTVGQTVTPPSAASVPATSNCKTYSTISNGIPTQALSSNAFFTYTPGMTFDFPTTSATASPVVTTDKNGKVTTSMVANAASNGKSRGTAQVDFGATLALSMSAIAVIAGLGAVMF